MNQEECAVAGGEWKEVDGAMVCVMPEVEEVAAEVATDTPEEEVAA